MFKKFSIIIIKLVFNGPKIVKSNLITTFISKKKVKC